MTAQIGDVYRLEAQKYTCLRMTAEPPFRPGDYGLHPTRCSTACWRGHWCEYDIRDATLYLDTLHIHNAGEYYPPILGVSPSPVELVETEVLLEDGTVEKVMLPRHIGYETYENLRLKMDYTGKALVAADFDFAYYRHIGFQTPIGFAKLLSLEFEHGELTEIVDHAETMKTLRSLITSPKARGTFHLAYRQLPPEVLKTMWWVDSRSDL